MSVVLGPHREDASRSGWQYRLHLDAPLMFALIAVSMLGLIVLYSAGGGDIALVERQLVRLGIAYTGMLVVAQLSPGLLLRMTPWLFVLGVLFLLAVLIGDIPEHKDCSGHFPGIIKNRSSRIGNLIFRTTSSEKDRVVRQANNLTLLKCF